jgi:hypothetical protein
MIALVVQAAVCFVQLVLLQECCESVLSAAVATVTSSSSVLLSCVRTRNVTAVVIHYNLRVLRHLHCEL